MISSRITTRTDRQRESKRFNAHSIVILTVVDTKNESGHFIKILLNVVHFDGFSFHFFLEFSQLTIFKVQICTE